MSWAVPTGQRLQYSMNLLLVVKVLQSLTECLLSREIRVIFLTCFYCGSVSDNLLSELVTGGFGQCNLQ